MEQSEAKLWSLLHAPEGPLACHLDAFARDLNTQGFRRRSIRVRIRLSAKFSLWLKTNAVDLDTVSDAHVDHFLRHVDSDQSMRRGDRSCLHALMAFLRRTGAASCEPAVHRAEATAIQNVVVAFGEHLRDAQALSRATCIQYLPFVEQFLTQRFGSGACELSELRACDVVGFITRQATRLSAARSKSATSAMRSFLRYLRLRGDVALDLAAAVPTVPNWSVSGIPKAISSDHLRAVLDSCRREQAVGCRDYAILMLLARLGLRSGEIVALTLDSIDWDRGCLTVAGSKVAQNSELPLPADVGSAIAEYLQRGRPRSDTRKLFLRATAPIRGLGSQTSIASIVVAAIARAGVHPPHSGSHQFRHALACDLLRHGANLTEIGNLLRHRHEKTTSIYAKVDFAALRPLSLAWPGVAQ